MLIVTGASGQLGRNIVLNLLRHVPAARIGVSVRDPQKLADFEALGVRVRQGDYENKDSLLHAWQGAERVLLVSSNAAATGGDTLKQHATAIEVARQLKVDRVFYTSQISSAKTSLFPPARHHAATETMLAASGVKWTALRHGFYADSALAMNARGIASRNLVSPADGKVSWTTHSDLAEVDAVLLASNEIIDGHTPPLTGSEALDLADLAQLAGRITGSAISRSIISDEEMRGNAVAAGISEERIAVMMGYYLAARAGEFATVDRTLARILGRDAETMQTYMAKALV